MENVNQNVMMINATNVRPHKNVENVKMDMFLILLEDAGKFIVILDIVMSVIEIMNVRLVLMDIIYYIRMFVKRNVKLKVVLSAENQINVINVKTDSN